MVSISDQEKEILEFWKKNKIFHKSLEKTGKKESYVFYDGPPFATGMPHYGHILGSVTKDVFGRFHTMQGKYVRRTWGWDCHGLPIENIAEKRLKIDSKDEIEKIGIKKFNDYCRKCVMEYSGAWKDVVDRIGRWVDMDNDYKTMDNNYIESVWWAFKQLWNKDYIYEGEKVLMYCPRCSTPLSKAEIAMDNSYKTIKENSIVIKFKLKDEDAYALAWTTTPWTLPSNLALAVNPDLDYIYIKDKTNGETYLIARDVLDDFYKNKKDYEIVKNIKGKKLEGKEYEPLFSYFKNTKNSFKFVVGDFVNSEDGTGIVHTAPAFGEEDYEICKKYEIPTIQPVDEKGRFTEEVKDFKGKFVHHSNKEIIEFLKKQGKIVLIKNIEHEYPFCYRCETKLIYRAIPAWFVNIQKIKPKLIKMSKNINWHPNFLKDGRVKHTIETAPDWNISRNRYWASAIPLWVSEDGEKIVIGSVDELKKYAKNLKGKVDLHKDFLDKIILEKDGKEFRRVPEVLDCWFESGSMTFAQFHYPFKNEELFKKNFPADFVAEYIAQVRTWFYYMMVLSAILFEEIPFKNVVTTGTILAEDGEKMSKSKNNFTDPLILVNKYGADALRFYLIGSSVMNAEDMNFSDKGVEEIYKKIILILYNSLRFYKIVSKNSDGKIEKPSKKNITDKWILSRLEKFGNNVESYLKNYNTIKSCSEIREFVDDLSTWYIRVNRDRFEESASARATLKYIIETLSKIIAPIIPFISEKIYLELNKEKSVHLEKYPKFDEKNIDDELLGKMSEVREIVSLGLKERDREQIGLRWPLSKIIIHSKSKKDYKEFEQIIKEQLNVKSIVWKKSKSSEQEISVKLDTSQTPDLEAEGYAREISRKVQSFRKNLNLDKKDRIKLTIVTDGEFKKILEKNNAFIKERTGSKTFEIVTTLKEKFKNKISFKIKNKRGTLGITVSEK
ncbi:MAG: isoleucine--tRNA ligase [Candidatus Pacearchaeota archaeon]